MRIFSKYYYVKWYEENSAMQNCGYVKIESANGKTKCFFYLSNISKQISSVAEVYFITKDEQVRVGNIFIRQGKCRENLFLNIGLTDGEIQGIEIPIREGRMIKCQMQEIKSEKMVEHLEIQEQNKGENRIHRMREEEKNKQARNQEEINQQQKDSQQQEENYQQKESKQQEENDKQKEDYQQAEIQSAEEPAQSYFQEDTKWDALKKQYPNIHIFGEEAEVLLIKPKDLVVLTEQYQDLISNSFLLHGYYNYRQLLLLKWNQQEPKYYIGVPGNFYDREKNVAIMFGFESFENGESSRREGQKEGFPGAFGYYLKEVGI